MDGYKLPPKKPIRRSRRAVSKSNDVEEEGASALRKKAQYDAMMAEIESEGSDEDLKDVRKFTARSGGFGRKVGNDDDLKKASEIDNFGKPRKISAGSWGEESDYGPDALRMKGHESSKTGEGSKKVRKNEATMEDLHRAEFGDHHSFRRRSAARRAADESSSSEEQEEDTTREPNRNDDESEGKVSDGRNEDVQKAGRFSIFKRSKKPSGEAKTEEAIKGKKAKDKRKEGKGKAKSNGKQRLVDPVRMRNWLTRPCRQGDKPLLCYVTRDRSGSKKLYPVYRVFLDDGRKEFIMMGRKRSGKATSNFLITMDHDVIDRSSDLILGKLRANMTGSEYTIYDHGMSPSPNISAECIRRELGILNFQYDKMGPGKIQFAIPKPKAVFRPVNDDEKIHNVLKAGDTSKLITGTNKRPKWDEHAGGHVLNFHGRVTLSSVKNFQLVSDVTGEDTVLQFGRVDKEKFTMDVSYPLSPIQAFAIVLASMDRKIADSSFADGMKSVRKSWFGFSKKKGEGGGKDGEESEEEDVVDDKKAGKKDGSDNDDDHAKRPWERSDEED